MDSSSEDKSPLSYASIVRGCPSPSEKWSEYQKEGDAEATAIALLQSCQVHKFVTIWFYLLLQKSSTKNYLVTHFVNTFFYSQSGGTSDQSDSGESLKLTKPTPGFGNCPRGKVSSVSHFSENVLFVIAQLIPLFLNSKIKLPNDSFLYGFVKSFVLENHRVRLCRPAQHVQSVSISRDMHQL